MQGRGGAVDGDRMGGAGIPGNALFEQGHLRTLGQEVRLQHLHHGIDIRLGNVLPAVGNHAGASYSSLNLSNSRICLASRKSGLLPELYS